MGFVCLFVFLYCFLTVFSLFSPLDPTLFFGDEYQLFQVPRMDAFPSPGLLTPYLYTPFFATPAIPTPTALGGASASTAAAGYFQFAPTPEIQSVPVLAPTAPAVLPASVPGPSDPAGRVRAAVSSLRGEKFITKQSLDGVILTSTENVQKFLGYESYSLRNTSIYELIHPEDVDKVLALHLKLFEQGSYTSLSTSYRVLRRTGDYTQIQSIFLLETAGSAQVIICASVDLQPPKYSPTATFFSEGQLATGSSSNDKSQLSAVAYVPSGGFSYQQVEQSIVEPPQSLSEEYEDDDAHGHDDHEDSDGSRTSLSPVHFAEHHAAHSSEDDVSDDDDNYGATSNSHKIRAKARGRIVQKAIGRTSHGNPKRERRMRRPPFGDFCGECRVPESTEWRKGPTPDHLLCNACGLRYTRKVKKEQRAKKQTQ